MMAHRAVSLIAPRVSSLTNTTTGKRVTRAAKGQDSRFHPLLALPLMIKVVEKRVTRARRGYNSIDKYKHF